MSLVMTKLSLTISLGLLCLVAATAMLACSDEPTLTPTHIPTATEASTIAAVVTPTMTPVPVEVPKLSSTPTPIPTLAQAPVATMASTPTMEPTETATPEPTSTPTYAPVPTVTQVPVATPPVPTATHTAVPTLQPAPTMTPIPQVKLLLDASAEVAGYWSDGTANLELAISLTNEGNTEVEKDQHLSMTCLQSSTLLSSCGLEANLPFPDGYRSDTERLTLRVPVGEVSFSFEYGGSETYMVDFTVPERILGVDRDVVDVLQRQIQSRHRLGGGRGDRLCGMGK